MELDSSKLLWLAGGIGLGAGLMYLIDPDRGRARRTMLTNKTGGFILHTNTTIGKAARDIGREARGAAIRTGYRLRPDYMSDDKLMERIRQAVENDKDLHITVHNGRVSMSGPILANRVQRLIEQIAMVPGVVGVDNRLTLYQSPAEMPVPRSDGGGQPMIAQ